MEDVLLSQYSSIRQTILKNVETIGNLISQAKNLQQIIVTVTDTKLKESLEEQIKGINETITSLLDQTSKLFDSYEEFVRTAFQKD